MSIIFLGRNLRSQWALGLITISLVLNSALQVGLFDRADGHIVFAPTLNWGAVVQDWQARILIRERDTADFRDYLTRSVYGDAEPPPGPARRVLSRWIHFRHWRPSHRKEVRLSDRRSGLSGFTTFPELLLSTRLCLRRGIGAAPSLEGFAARAIAWRAEALRKPPATGLQNPGGRKRQCGGRRFGAPTKKNRER